MGILKDLEDFGVYAEIEIKNLGQRPAWWSDAVEVSATVMLPTDESGCLDSRARFGCRLVVCEQALNRNWGFQGPGKFRSVSEVFHSRTETYEELRETAAEWACDELGKLLEALEERRDILRHATEG